MKELIPGEETIQSAQAEEPSPLDRDVIEVCEKLRQVLNAHGIAFVPYCVKCRKPLVWHYGDGNILFSCDSCKGNWLKGEGW